MAALHSGFAGVTAHKYSLYALVDILNAPDTKWASCRGGGGDNGEYALAKKGFGEGSALKGKSHLCIPFLGIVRPQSKFPHSCVCERFIYSIPRIGPPFRIGRPDPGNI